MSSTNGGPSVTTTPNVVVQAVPAGSSSVPFDPSSVAITEGTIRGLSVSSVAGVDTSPVLGIIGDSRPAQSYLTSSSLGYPVTRNPPYGIVGWACFLSNDRVRSSLSYNKAISGSLVSDLAGQLTNLLAVSPRCTHVVILAGTNSFTADVSGATAWSQLSAVLTTIQANGLQAIVCMDLPRLADGTWTTARMNNSQWFNQLIRQNAPALGAWVIDPARYIADPASSVGNPLTNYSYDGIHPATLGAYYAGKELSDAIVSRLVTPILPGFTNRGDVYHATNNPLGNCIPYGLFTGTGGSNVSSAGVASGSVADGWQNRTLTGTGTAAASLVARTDGKPGFWQQVILTSGSGSSTYRFGLINALVGGTDFPASGKFVLEGDFNVSSATGLDYIWAAISNFDGASTITDGVQAFGDSLLVATRYPMPGAFAGRFRTPPMTYNSAGGQMLLRFEAQVTSGAATIQIGNVAVRPLPSTALT